MGSTREISNARSGRFWSIRTSLVMHYSTFYSHSPHCVLSLSCTVAMAALAFRNSESPFCAAYIILLFPSSDVCRRADETVLLNQARSRPSNFTSFRMGALERDGRTLTDQVSSSEEHFERDQFLFIL